MKSIYKQLLAILLLASLTLVLAQDFVDDSLNSQPKDAKAKTTALSANPENTPPANTRELSLPAQRALTPVLPQDVVANSQDEEKTTANDKIHMEAVTTHVNAKPVPILFSVSGKVKKAWLFGTMHVPDPRITQLTPELRAAIDESDVILTEARMNLFTEAYMQAAVMRDDNKTLKDVLPATVQKDLNNYLRWVKYGGTIDNLNHMKVWAVYASINVLKKQLQYPDIIPLDTKIYKQAVADNKIAEGIETVEEQVRHLENFSEQEQITLLAETLQMLQKDQDDNHDSMEEMLQWYLQGAQTDLKDLMRHILPAKRDLALEKKFMRIMFYDRNRIMAKRIAKHFQNAPNKTYFIAVGAGHLSGTDSIQDHLREYGYTVERAP